MPFGKFVDSENIDKERRKAISKSIRPISVEGIKKLSEEILHDPGRDFGGKRSFSRIVIEI
jgi:hypothetical protein